MPKYEFSDSETKLLTNLVGLVLSNIEVGEEVVTIDKWLMQNLYTKEETINELRNISNKLQNS